MKTRFVGVVAAFAAIVVVFAAVVLTIAAIEDYEENKGQSFIERAASIVGIGSLTEEVVEVNDEDVYELEKRYEVEKRSSDAPEIFRFFGRTEDSEEWLDDLFEDGKGGWLGGEEYFEFEDRIEEELPFGRFDFEGRWRADWIDELVERGIMTREDADEFKSWLEDLPAEFEERAPNFSDDRDFEFDSDDGRFRFRWRWDGSDDDWFFENRPEYDKGCKNGV